MLKTVSPPEPQTAIALRQSDGGTGVGADLRQAVFGNEEKIAALLSACVREKRNAERQHLRNAARSTLANAGVMAIMFGISAILAKLGWWLFPGILFSAANTFALEWFSPLPSTPAQRNAATAAHTAIPDDSRTLLVLLDTLPRASWLLWRFFHFPRADYATVFAALASALWNADGNIAPMLTESRRAELRFALDKLWESIGNLTGTEADFCAAIIKTLAVVGDRKAERLFRRIAADHTTDENRKFVRSLATDALPILREHAAEWQECRRRFRALLRPRNGVFDAIALETFLLTCGNDRAAVLLRDELQKIDWKKPILLTAIAGLVTMAAVIMFVAPVYFLTVVFLAILPFAALKLFVGLIQEMKRGLSGSNRKPNKRERQNKIAYHIERIGDLQLLAPVLDMLRLSGNNGDPAIRSALSLLNALRPGDGVYLEARHIRFLRGVVGQRRSWFRNAAWNTDFIAAATHALEIVEVGSGA